MRTEVTTTVRTFVAQRCAEHLGGLDDLAVLDDVLTGLVRRGKYVRSTVMMAGWSAGGHADDAALARVLPHYDRLRSELAVGQFRELVNEARRRPTLRAVREVARAKSGNYTVRGPLGAVLAGVSPTVLDDLAAKAR